ncbi:MarR family winged helix-turn-helix transcriptional regulator [Sphingopyxis sp. EG6]|jgi:DNA-binding MarR family transcriptional regulator|uniref:MarR family winged helix-turn-helix transcriptional regulator n=1 Tax=Sphingopyxis sp. EG6 TaxID=1874061 RepID=UPI000DC617EB|nr:MarR family transcriptional regulator [Sphingopyxis sp. EG6]BBB08709.1 transcriptional regulator [Sphingopyxis sp. EG6]
MGQSGDRLINLFGAVSQGVSDRVRVAISDAFPVGGEAAAALIVIGHNPGMSIEQISRILRLSHAGTVRLVKRLASQNLVAKTPSSSDRRMACVILTPAGEVQCAELLTVRNRAVAELLEGVPGPDCAALERIAQSVLISLFEQIAPGELSACRFCDQRHCKDCPMKPRRGSFPSHPSGRNPIHHR